MKTLIRTLLCTALLALPACSLDESGDRDGEDGELTEIALDDSEMQGRTVLSHVLDQKDLGSFMALSMTSGAQGTRKIHVRLSGTLGLEAIEATGSVLYPVGDPGLEGTVLKDAKYATRTVTITGVEPDPNFPGAFLYELLYRTSAADPGVNPCKYGLAMAIPGFYDANARRQTSANKFSFSCELEGVARKCFTWGYPFGSGPGDEAFRAHQLCTRMARASYCKQNETYTLDETHIQIWDTYQNIGFDEPVWTDPVFAPLATWPPPPNVYKFEAIWPEDDDEPVLCLGKTRWQALELDALAGCPIPVPDPRTTPGAKFCEDKVAEAHGFPADTKIVNASPWADLPLESWRKGASDRVSSVQGYYVGPPPRPIGVTPKAPYPQYTTHVETHGTILRSLPGSILPVEVRDVWSYTSGGARVLGRSDSTAWPASYGYNQGTWEGMVFKNPPESGFPNTAELFLFHDTVSGDYFNSTQDLSSATVDQIDSLGYLLVP